VTEASGETGSIRPDDERQSGNDSALARIREAIDAIDQRLLSLLNERGQLALEVGNLKAADGAPVYRPEREAQVVARLVSRSAGPLGPSAIEAIWREVMSACRGLERRPTVAYLGPAGTFSEQAMHQRFGADVEGVACASIDEVFRETEAGNVDFGIVPVENSTEGAVNRTLDLLQQSPLLVSGEITVLVRHILMTASGDMRGITRICAHPQALAQCAGWLNRNHPTIERAAVASNAEGARLAAGDPTVAGIAGRAALERYAVKAVAEGIQDDPSNRTRFLVIGSYRCGPTGNDQTSLILSVPDRAGALYALIEPLARHGVSMKRFESRPARQYGWKYYFHIDLIGHEADPPVAAALAELKARAALFKSLGSYPTPVDADRGDDEPRPGALPPLR
jgi:chorismate mutase/prephenate dehydratase